MDLVADYSDIVQVGARNVQNFTLLKRLGKIQKPVMLKRGPEFHHQGVPAFGRVHRHQRQSQRFPL